MKGLKKFYIPMLSLESFSLNKKITYLKLSRIIILKPFDLLELPTSNFSQKYDLWFKH